MGFLTLLLVVACFVLVACLGLVKMTTVIVRVEN
jgi:multisubunit Na+/H+ antiporter MnhG subunit